MAASNYFFLKLNKYFDKQHKSYGMDMKIFLLLHIVFLQGDCKILRIREHYVAKFVLVDSDHRIKSNCIQNITKFTTPQECSYECIKNNSCVSINRHRELGICELLSISKFNESGLLQRDPNWVHYETDDDEQNIGSLCTSFSPCKSYQVCEMTFECNPAFICRCRDGFSGNECETYQGPGTSQSNPAASCDLLLSKYKTIPDGDYWLKGYDRKNKCERKVDGGYTNWSSFTTCSPCGGYQERNRSCINPIPKGGGFSCDRLGPKTEVRSCYKYKKCPECSYHSFYDNIFTVPENTYVYATSIKTMKEYKVEMDLKLDKLPPQTINIFGIGYEKDSIIGSRYPLIVYYKQKLYICSVVNGAWNYFHVIRNPLVVFKDWTRLEVSQKKIGSSYFFRVLVNGEEHHKKKNDKPIELIDLKIIFSPHIISPKNMVMVKNLYIEGYCNVTLQ